MTIHFPENLRDLRLFVAVYEERSFTMAALRENATQSGVSQHIRKLEEMLGSQLLTRKSGSVVPTPAGEAFYHGCINVFKALDAASRKLETFEGGLEGEVKIGVTPTIARSVLAPALSRFVAAYPNVVVYVSEAYSAAVTDKVRAGEIDVAIVPAMPEEAGITGHLVTRTHEHLVASHATAEHLRLWDTAGVLPDLKLVMPSRAQARRALLDRYIATTSINVVQRLEMDSMFGTLDFVATTNWVTILPAIMLTYNPDPRLATFALRCPPLLLDLFRIESARRPLTAAARELISCFEKEARQHQADIERSSGDITAP